MNWFSLNAFFMLTMLCIGMKYSTKKEWFSVNVVVALLWILLTYIQPIFSEFMFDLIIKQNSLSTLQSIFVLWLIILFGISISKAWNDYKEYCNKK